ncbi:ATP-dependent 5'-3' DNA helicase HCS1 SCDLUD_003077 [Saccharomycodes ludwigii]|uniref:ATP-dependent 5'-3' DNA helicase HCS1 n=1 Tax=Saccharomycodes ludwigii TaxID=36035 RepID=UPI001E857B55|nr:hypothetical protein SCDLUD_003077 [Saccharomycodes ludwigii]KAH3900110.1 hypothetical protein SCDLUD_003077 [Saccharomycodes ludwigii]
MSVATDSASNKLISERFLNAIVHEQAQDVELTTKLLNNLPLKKLVSNGYALNNLVVENIRTGLGGKLYVELAPDSAISQEITNTGDFKVGDIVIITSSSSSSRSNKLKKTAQKTSSNNHNNNGTSKNKNGDIIEEGVIFKIKDSLITISIDEAKAEPTTISDLYSSKKLHIIKTTNQITYTRMCSTMRRLNEYENLPNNEIMQYLLCEREFVARKNANDGSSDCSSQFHNDQLNTSQKKAIDFALNNTISIIHGPPGTGKTYTLVELIAQLYDRGERILVCGPSNISVDTILERLGKVIPGNELLRIGHPARLLEANLSHSLDVLAKTGENGSILKDLRKEIDDTILKIKKYKSYKDLREGWKMVKELRKDLKRREIKVTNDLIIQSKVVVCTLHGSSSKVLLQAYDIDPKLFSTLIIDEVSQSLEPQCWIPLISHYRSNMKRLVLAGDNKQLPPTVKTEDNDAIKNTLSKTIFDRLEDHYGDSFKLLLNVQYRMNKKIMEFSSKEMYENKLLAADSVANRLLSDLPGVDVDENTEIPLIWYDTQGDDFLEGQERDDSDGILISSKYNENEAYLVLKHVKDLLNSNVLQDHIGIISPYSAQVSLLKSLVHSKYSQVEISTVDGFQGREKEVIILSLVRSNDTYDVGFLRDDRRLNVAMTRPRRQLCVIGNMETLERSNIKFLKDWVSWAEENMEIRYPDISELLQDN